jgi:alkenylglycerophosphocholine/alkenylglycerophosphoethanolamine hydrolase
MLATAGRRTRAARLPGAPQFGHGRRRGSVYNRVVSPLSQTAVLAVLAVGALAIFSSERRIGWMHAIAKPLATALLVLIVGWPRTRLAVWVDVGIALSVVGDVALLDQGDTAFIVGLAAFLLAHLAYVVGFIGAAGWAPWLALVVLLAGATTTTMLRAIWPGTAGMHAPVVAYGLAITAMVTAAFGTLASGLAGGGAAAAGALLFYASDASLALNRFRRPIPHAPFLTLGLYWLGQIGIAIAAR